MLSAIKTFLKSFLITEKAHIQTIKKINVYDSKYDALKEIQPPELDEENKTAFLYLYINKNKDYFLTVNLQDGKYETQIQKLGYKDDESDNRVYWLGGITITANGEIMDFDDESSL